MGVAAWEDVKPRPADAGPRGEALDRRVQQRRLRDRELTRAERCEDDPRPVPEDRRRHEQADDEEDARQPKAADPPAERECRHEAAEKKPRLQDVPHREEHGAARLVAVGSRQTSRRPVRLRRITPARAVEEAMFWSGMEDVPVQLEVRDASIPQ